MAKFTRALTEDQVVAIAAGRVRGLSMRAISRAEDIPYETVRDASKRPEVTSVVEQVSAEIAATEREQAEAVKRDHKREGDATRQRRATARKTQAKIAAERRESVGRSPSSGDGGRILGVFTFPTDHRDRSGGEWIPNRALPGSQLTPTERKELDARIYPEDVPLSAVQVLDANGAVAFSASFDVLKDNLARIAVDVLSALGWPDSEHNAIVESLSRAEPGKCVSFRVETPVSEPVYRG